MLQGPWERDMSCLLFIYLTRTLTFFTTGVIFRLFLRNQEVVGSTGTPDLKSLFPEEN